MPPWNSFLVWQCFNLRCRTLHSWVLHVFSWICVLPHASTITVLWAQNVRSKACKTCHGDWWKPDKVHQYYHRGQPKGDRWRIQTWVPGTYISNHEVRVFNHTCVCTHTNYQPMRALYLSVYGFVELVGHNKNVIYACTYACTPTQASR